VGRIGNIVSYLERFHIRGYRRSIVDCGCCIPNFDDGERPFRRYGDSCKSLFACRQKTVRDAVDHHVDERFVHGSSLNLLRPRSACLVLWRFPDWRESLAHEEEHPGFPRLFGNGVHDGPELLRSGNVCHHDVTPQRIVLVLGIVIPQHPRILESCGSNFRLHYTIYSCLCRKSKTKFVFKEHLQSI